MSDSNVVEVTDKAGWRKTFSLAKAIIYIGSDSRSDVVLEAARGGGVSPRHVQLIAVAGAGYRLINIGDYEIRVGNDEAALLPPRAFIEIGPGDLIQVGEFTLLFQGAGHGAGAAVRDSVSNSIGISMSLGGGQLGPGQPLDGMATVRNLGDRTGVQFRLEADGLDPACVEIGPGPLLFPNAEKDVPFRLHHPRAARPPAGEFRFRIRASAPTAYPGQSATATQVIEILPYYSHKVRVVNE